jgi:hypothetical protein
MALREPLRLAAFGIALVLPVSAVAAKLTEKNSVTVKYFDKGMIGFDGKGCNVPKQSSTPVDLEPGAINVQVVTPKVGDRNGDARITAISVGANAVTFTAVADGAELCGPKPDYVEPPAEREWAGSFPLYLRESLKLRTRYRVERHIKDIKTVSKPSKIKLPGLGTISRIRWKSFGGRTAVGTGRLKFPARDHCNPRKCLGHNGRFRITLTKPSFCRDIGPTAIQYGKMRWVPLRRMGRIRAGSTYVSKKSDCLLEPLRPVPR